jgi:hypothetical protein
LTPEDADDLWDAAALEAAAAMSVAALAPADRRQRGPVLGWGAAAAAAPSGGGAEAAGLPAVVVQLPPTEAGGGTGRCSVEVLASLASASPLLARFRPLEAPGKVRRRGGWL